MFRFVLLTFFILLLGCPDENPKEKDNLQIKVLDIVPLDENEPKPENIEPTPNLPKKEPTPDLPKKEDTSNLPKKEDTPDLNLEKDNQKVEDDLSKIGKSLTATIHKKKPEFLACYQNLLDKESIFFKGEIHVNLRISGNGKITEVTVVKDSIKRTELFDCLVRVLKEINFDKSDKIFIIIYKFKFIDIQKPIAV